jgi:O-methyltransferase
MRVRIGDVLVPERELEEMYRKGLLRLLERSSRTALGDYVEFGVYVGTSLACMHRVTNELGLDHIRLIGFDSFAGLPATAASDDEGTWLPGSFAVDESIARDYLTKQGVDWERVVLVPGWFDETLTEETRTRLGLARASVIMVDCDMYSSAKTALEFCEPLIADEAVVIFDDWHSADLAERGLGEKRAFLEFLSEHPHFFVEEFGTYIGNARVFLVSRQSTEHAGLVGGSRVTF